MKKRSLAMVIMAVGALLLSGCSGGGAQTSDDARCIPTSPEQVGEWCEHDGPLRIAYVQGTSEHSFYNTVGIGARAAGEELGVEVDVQGASQFNPAEQTPIINAVIESKPDALIVSTTSPTALNPLLQSAAKAGIVVFTVDNDTDTPELRWTNIGTDPKASGEVLGQLVSAAADSGVAGILASSPGPLLERLRIEGVQSGLASAGTLEALDVQYCEGDVAKCSSMTDAILSANSDARAILSVGEPMGVGAGNAVRASGRDDILVASFDASPAQQRDLKQGNVDFLVVQRPYLEGYEIVSIATQFLKGGPISSPLLDDEVQPEDLPANLIAGFDIAVADKSLCSDEVEASCGTIDDEAIAQYLYVG